MQLTVLGALRRLDHTRLRGEFYREWEVALRNKLANADALEQMGPQQPPALEAMRQVLVAGLDKGRPINIILKLSPEVFPPLDAALLVAGESYGSLKDSLRLLSLYYVRDFSRMAKIRSWSIVPIGLALIASFVLPFPLLWDVSARAYSTAIIASVVGFYALGGIVISLMFSFAEGTARISRPRFAWALAVGLEAGLTFAGALTLASQISGISSIGRHVAKIPARQAKDMSLLRLLEGAPGTWPALIERAAVCEQTGEYIATLHVFAQSLEPQA